jgi:short-subunit dehydrogenase
MSSVCGFLGFPGNVAYSTAKFGVKGFSESLLNETIAVPELRHITVSCVHPGAIQTELFTNSSSHVTDTNIAQAGVVLKKEQMQKMLTAAGGTSSKAAAQQILNQTADGYTRIMVGLDAKIFDWAIRFAPRFFYGRFTFSALTVTATLLGKLNQLKTPIFFALLVLYWLREKLRRQ